MHERKKKQKGETRKQGRFQISKEKEKHKKVEGGKIDPTHDVMEADA